MNISSSPFGSSCPVFPTLVYVHIFSTPAVGGEVANAQTQRVKRMICEGGLSFVTTRRGKWRRARALQGGYFKKGG